LVRSEQFALNEALGRPGLREDRDQGNGGGEGERSIFGVHAPEGTGVAELFGDLVAAMITERARRIADLPDPAAAFGQIRSRDGFMVSEPAEELTGYEIVLTMPEPGNRHARPGPGLPPIGAAWRDRAARADYFASTARLADGVGAWAMLAARLGDQSTNRAFAERWWRGAMRGTDVLFPAGDSMAMALARLKGTAVYWPACVGWFRASLAKVHGLAAERMEVAAALSRLSQLEQAWEEASEAVEVAEARLALLTVKEPAVRDAVAVAEEDYRARLAALGAHELGRPEFATVTPQGMAALRSRGALGVALAGGMRRGRNWRGWSVARRELRAACAAAERAWDAALRESESLRTDVAAARAAVADATAVVSRLAAEIEPLAAAVAAARQRWGDHVPVGPSQAETEDPALIEWRETSAPWADREYANARADVFISALELHKALIAARADVFRANLEALMHLLSATGATAGPAGTVPAGAGQADPELAEFALAAWRSFFLVVPVVQIPFEVAGTLFADLEGEPLGWLFAGHADKLAADDMPGMLRRFSHAVFAGDTVLAEANALAGNAAQAERAAALEASMPAESTVSAGSTALAQAAGLPRGGLPGQHSVPVQTAVLGGDAIPAQRTAQHVADQLVRYGTWLPAGDGDGSGGAPRWVGAPLRVVRGQDRMVVNQRNDLAYDGLLITGRD
jgi:hypothetical protein